MSATTPQLVNGSNTFSLSQRVVHTPSAPQISILLQLFLPLALPCTSKVEIRPKTRKSTERVQNANHPVHAFLQTISPRRRPGRIRKVQKMSMADCGGFSCHWKLSLLFSPTFLHRTLSSQLSSIPLSNANPNTTFIAMFRLLSPLLSENTGRSSLLVTNG